MKNIKEIKESLLVVQSQIKHRRSRQAEPLNDFAARNINSIFKSLCLIFPNWRNVYRSTEELQEAKNTFAKGMMENGIVSSEQVKRGLAKARSQESDFFPSVGKFCAWCRDDTQWQAAFQRMLTREPAQSLVEQKARGETSWLIRNLLNAADAEKKFKRAYEKYQVLELQGLIAELPQLSTRSSETEFDKKRNATTVHPEKFEPNSIFARIAKKGSKGAN